MNLAALDLYDAAELRDPTGPVRRGPGFSSGVLRAMVADGVLRHVIDEVYLPTPSWEQSVHRAAALAVLLPSTPVSPRCNSTGVLVAGSAAWVWGGPLPTRVIAAHRRADLRAHHPLVVARQCETFHRNDIHVFERYSLGVHQRIEVSTPLRTAMDLALQPDATDGTDEALRWLLHTLVEPAQVLRGFERHRRLANVVQARERIARLVTDR